MLGVKLIATMKRPGVKGDFRSNVSQGSKPKSLELTELEMEHCLKAAKAVNGLWTAVDFIPSKNRDKLPPFLLEVNSSPGTEGMEEATGRNISKDVIDHFADKKNWVKTAEEVGYKEVVHVNPFGELIGKFDTGNSVLSVIHGEDVKINNGMVEFILDGKKVKRPLVRKYTTKIGSIRQYEEERPVVAVFAADKSPKSVPFPVEAMVIYSITSDLAGRVDPPCDIPRVLEFILAPSSYLAADKSPKSVASPVEAIVT